MVSLTNWDETVLLLSACIADLESENNFTYLSSLTRLPAHRADVLDCSGVHLQFIFQELVEAGHRGVHDRPQP